MSSRDTCGKCDVGTRRLLKGQPNCTILLFAWDGINHSFVFYHELHELHELGIGTLDAEPIRVICAIRG